MYKLPGSLPCPPAFPAPGTRIVSPVSIPDPDFSNKTIKQIRRTQTKYISQYHKSYITYKGSHVAITIIFLLLCTLWELTYCVIP